MAQRPHARRELRSWKDREWIVFRESELTSEVRKGGNRKWTHQTVLMTTAELQRIMSRHGLKEKLGAMATELLDTVIQLQDRFEQPCYCGGCLQCRTAEIVQRARLCPDLDVDSSIRKMKGSKWPTKPIQKQQQ